MPPWELTDAIDRGDTAAALDRPFAHDRRRRTASASDPGDAARVTTAACCDSTGSDASDEKSAAALLGLKGSTFPARKALDQARRLGPQGVARAVKLLAAADLDLRGAWSGRTTCARGAGRPAVASLGGAGRAGGRLGLLGGQLLHEARLAPGGLVLVDDALGGGLVEALLQPASVAASASVAGARARTAALTRVFSSDRTALLRSAALARSVRLRFFWLLMFATEYPLLSRRVKPGERSSERHTCPKARPW